MSMQKEKYTIYMEIEIQIWTELSQTILRKWKDLDKKSEA